MANDLMQLWFVKHAITFFVKPLFVGNVVQQSEVWVQSALSGHRSEDVCVRGPAEELSNENSP